MNKLKNGHKRKKLLEFRSVSKTLVQKTILTDISFSVYQGEKIGILGPVGAGKSTLLYTALGLIKPDKGRIKVFSLPLEANRREILQRINFASSSLKLNGYASVWENLMTFARLYGVFQPKEKIHKLSLEFGISPLLDIKVYRLSAGENTKVNLTKAFLNEPEILYLDEIMAYLDFKSVRTIKNKLKELNRKNKLTLVYVSHNLEDVKSLCDRVIVINKGRIRYMGGFPSVKKLMGYYD